MRKSLKICAFLAAIAIVAGCASKQDNQPEESQAYVKNLMPGYSQEIVRAQPASAEGHKIVSHAKRAIGTPYVLGGSGPGGFDCSGLVKWAYNNVGVELPRTAREQSVIGQKIQNVEDMRAGDIVAFRHPKRGYHTGIYMGDGKFIHSPRKRSRVKINSLSDPYFQSTLLGARRVSMEGSTNLVAEAESRLGAYMAERGQQELARQNTRVKASINSRKKASASKSKAGANSTKSVVASRKSAKSVVVAKNSKSSRVTATKNSRQATKQVKKQVTKTVAQHKAKATASKKPAHKTVSMLKPKTKTSARRSHS